MIDLEAYFGRIGFTGIARHDRATLAAIQRLHPQAIAFENLDPLLGVPVLLDPASLQSKLVRSARGGFCYEHNLLLMHVLRTLGFSVRGLGARVLWGAAAGAITSRSHMLLWVDLDGASHIVDVGFGGCTPTAPVRLDREGAQETPHEAFRLLRSGEDFVLQAGFGTSWRPLYRFDLQEQFQADYEILNWYHSTSPQSPFTRDLMAARPVPGCRYALRNSEFSVHRPDGSSERRLLRSALELRDTLAERFGVMLADGAAVDSLLTRLTAVAA